jgi:hypothetical protein
MKLPFGKSGLSLFVFVALLLVFNWPLLSIPSSKYLFGWLFTAWALAIALLFLVAHGAWGKDAGPAESAQPRGPEHAEAGPEAGPDNGPDNGVDAGPGARNGDV